MGAGEASCTTMLSMFWERFAALYPQHDVCADINSGKVDPKYLVPLQMHGDGGRGYRKTEVMILQYQPILGAGTRAAPAEKVDLPLNYLGHSFCTRFLFAVMPKAFFKKNAKVLLKLARKFAEELRVLYDKGYTSQSGITFRFATVGMKGDLPYITKIAGFKRSFGRVRKRPEKANSKPLAGMCWLCLAGTPNYDFEDLSPTAPWISTIGSDPQPWTTPSRIVQTLRSDAAHIASFFKLDLFHICLAGVHKEYVASSLVHILGHYDGAMNAQLTQMNRDLHIFLRQHRVNLHCQELTLSLLGYNAKEYASGGWNKGQDSATLMKFVHWLLQQDKWAPLVNKKQELQLMRNAASWMNEFMSILHSSGCCLDGEKASRAGMLGQSCCVAYQKLAVWALDQHVLLYNLIPKLHCFHHAIVVMGSHAQAKGFAWNLLNDATPQDEDFVGRVARISRRTSSRVVPLRVLQRWQCAVLTELKGSRKKAPKHDTIALRGLLVRNLLCRPMSLIVQNNYATLLWPS